MCAVRADCTPEQRKLWKDRLRAANLGIPVEDLLKYDAQNSKPRSCPVCGSAFILSATHIRQLRSKTRATPYTPCCSAKCTRLQVERNLTPEQREARRTRTRRTVTEVHARRSPEERSAVAKKGHENRDYTKLREAQAAIPKAVRIRAAKLGHSNRTKGQLQKTWKEKPPEELSRIARQRIETCKRKGFYNGTSHWEEQVLLWLKQKLKTEVKTQYSDERYPYTADFYLPEFDTFIELHGFWTHGGAPFDPANPEHQRKLRSWKRKGKTEAIYRAAIKTWTVRDPHKVELAKQGRLNLYRFYSLDAVRAWLQELDRELASLEPQDSWFDKLGKINAGRIVKAFHFKSFHRHELSAWRNMGTRIRVFANRQTWAGIDPENCSDQTILTGLVLSGEARGYSSFDPAWFTSFIQRTGCVRVYDPCGGWGHRMLTAAATGIDYICNDVNARTVKGNRELREWVLPKTRSKIWIGNHDAARVEKTVLARLSPDAVFTCPPYHNAEVYSSSGAECLTASEFDYWWQCVVATFPSSVKHVGLVIPSSMCELFTKRLNVLETVSLSRGHAVFFGKHAHRRAREVLVVCSLC